MTAEELERFEVFATLDRADRERLEGRMEVVSGVAGVESRFAGKGIFYGAARSEAPHTHGLDLQIVGAGKLAGQAAMFFSSHVTAAHGEGALEAIDIRNAATGEEKRSSRAGCSSSAFQASSRAATSASAR